MIRLGLSITLFFMSIHVSTWAARREEIPVKDPSKLSHPVPTKVRRITTAKVVWANYALIREDFISLRNQTENQIDEWLESHAVISQAQANQVFFNETILTTAYDGLALRPENYNRAAVIQVPDGLIDIKGAGSEAPKSLWHDGDPRDGTFTLGDAIREQIFATAIKLIFESEGVKIAGQPVQVVENYAILDGGFDVIHRNRNGQEVGRSPWGLLFRRAHTRFKNTKSSKPENKGKYSLWNAQKSLAVELLLRKYGITTQGAGRKAGAAEGGINVQGTKGNAVLDFGNYVVKDHFETEKLYHFYSEKPIYNYRANHESHQIANPRLEYQTWGPYYDSVIDSKVDKPWVYSAETAKYVSEQIRSGNLAQARLAHMTHQRNMLTGFEEAMTRHKLKRCSRLSQ
jgi:hypothetical protein